MDSNQILNRISSLSGLTIQDIMMFCKNYSLSYVNLNEWYIKNSRMPNMQECAGMRRSGSVFINDLKK